MDTPTQGSDVTTWLLIIIGLIALAIGILAIFAPTRRILLRIGSAFLWLFGFISVTLLRPYLFLHIAVIQVILFAILGEFMRLLDDPDGESVIFTIRNRTPELFKRRARRYAAFGEQPDFRRILIRYAYATVVIILLIVSGQLWNSNNPSLFSRIIFWSGVVLAIGVVGNTVILLIYQELYGRETRATSQAETPNDSGTFIYNYRRPKPAAGTYRFVSNYQDWAKQLVTLQRTADRRSTNQRAIFRLAYQNIIEEDMYWYDANVYHLNRFDEFIQQVVTDGQSLIGTDGNQIMYAIYVNDKQFEADLITRDQVRTLIRAARVAYNQEK